MKIVLATQNNHKIQELTAIFTKHFGDKYTFVSMKDAGFEGDVAETGFTFEENARIKAITVCKHTGLITFADDSGL
jgi:XTP/dITP diphosphohydrolase